jgi:hypothetical protein
MYDIRARCTGKPAYYSKKAARFLVFPQRGWRFPRQAWLSPPKVLLFSAAGMALSAEVFGFPAAGMALPAEVFGFPAAGEASTKAVFGFPAAKMAHELLHI